MLASARGSQKFEVPNMGWIIYFRPPANIRDEIARICTFETDTRSARTIKTSLVAKVWYVAVEVTMKEGAPLPDDYQVDDQGRFVFAATFQTRRDRDGWAYRAIEEGAGPATALAPRSLIEMLSPTQSKWANSWRSRCLTNAARRARRLSDGDIIELAEPLEFSDGRKRSTFKVIKERPSGYSRDRTIFECIETAAQCRISGFMRRDWRHLAEGSGRPKPKKAVAAACQDAWLSENADAFTAQAQWHDRNGNPLAEIIVSPGKSSWL